MLFLLLLCVSPLGLVVLFCSKKKKSESVSSEPSKKDKSGSKKEPMNTDQLQPKNEEPKKGESKEQSAEDHWKKTTEASNEPDGKRKNRAYEIAMSEGQISLVNTSASKSAKNSTEANKTSHEAHKVSGETGKDKKDSSQRASKILKPKSNRHPVIHDEKTQQQTGES